MDLNELTASAVQKTLEDGRGEKAARSIRRILFGAYVRNTQPAPDVTENAKCFTESDTEDGCAGTPVTESCDSGVEKGDSQQNQGECEGSSLSSGEKNADIETEANDATNENAEDSDSEPAFETDAGTEEADSDSGEEGSEENVSEDSAEAVSGEDSDSEEAVSTENGAQEDSGTDSNSDTDSSDEVDEANEPDGTDDDCDDYICDSDRTPEVEDELENGQEEIIDGSEVEELLHTYCDENGLSCARSVIDKLLGMSSEKVTPDEIRHLAIAYRLNAAECSRLLFLCGYSPLRASSLYDVAFGALLSYLGKLPKDEVPSPEKAEELLLEKYSEALSCMRSALEADGEEKAEYSDYRLGNYTAAKADFESLPEFAKEHRREFSEIREKLLSVYQKQMAVLAELYDPKAINCTWQAEAEGEYSLYSFLSAFCTELPKRTAYTDSIGSAIEKRGLVPTREMIIITTLYAACFAGVGKTVYRGKPASSKKVPKEAALLMSEGEDGERYISLDGYFGTSKSLPMTSGLRLVHTVNAMLVRLGFNPLNDNLRFDRTVKLLESIEIKLKNGGRTVSVLTRRYNVEEYKLYTLCNLDIERVQGIVPPFLAAVFAVIGNVKEELSKAALERGDGNAVLPLECSITENP